MQTINLKEYVLKAKDLEAAIFTQEKLIRDYQRYAELQGPKKPATWIEPKNPYVYPEAPVRKTVQVFSIGYCTILFSLLFAFIFISLFETGEIATGFLSFLLLSVSFTLIRAIVLLKKRETKKQYSQRLQNYLEEVESIKEKESKWMQEVKITRKEHMATLHAYLDNIEGYKKDVATNINTHKQMLQQLKNTLSEYYSYDVIFDKYRNLVAVSAFAEYFQSGRCNTLEGADGAYNLYETELRQNIIIGQLSTIVTNIEQIKDNQYVLYREITNANQIVKELLTEIGADTKMAAYYAQLNAQIAAAPKYTTGHIR